MRLASETLGDGPDLVLLHGWGMNAAIWEDCAPQLAQSFRLHLIELPGHGRSPWDPGWRDLGSWAAACLEVAPPVACWIGWSLGGTLSLQAALMAPQRLRGLGLVTATPKFLRSDDWPQAMPEPTLRGFAGELLADPQLTMERFLALQVRGSEAGRETLRRLRQSLRARPRARAEALMTGLEILARTDLRTLLARLRLPSDWLFGDRDTLVPAGIAAQVSGLGNGIRTRVLTGVGHAPWLSHPTATLEWLRAFAL